MYCKRCGSPTDKAETCQPRCVSAKAYLKLIPYCVLCGKQQCSCSSRRIITVPVQGRQALVTISGGCK